MQEEAKECFADERLRSVQGARFFDGNVGESREGTLQQSANAEDVLKIRNVILIFAFLFFFFIWNEVPNLTIVQNWGGALWNGSSSAGIGTLPSGTNLKRRKFIFWRV